MTFAPYPASPLALDSPTIAAWVAAQLAQMRPGDKLREVLRGRASGHAAPLVAWYASAGERQLQIRVDSPSGKGEVLALERRDLSSAALAWKLQTLALRGGLDGWENPALARRPTGPGLWAAPSVDSALVGSFDLEAICARGLVIFVASDGRYVPAAREVLREPATAWKWRRLEDVGADWTPLVGLDREALERPVWAHVEEALRRRAAALAYSPAPAAPKPSGPAVGDVVGPAQIPPGAVVQHPSRDTYLARDTRPLVVATEEGPCDKESWCADFDSRDRREVWKILALGLPSDATAQQARVAAGLERQVVPRPRTWKVGDLVNTIEEAETLPVGAVVGPDADLAVCGGACVFSFVCTHDDPEAGFVRGEVPSRGTAWGARSLALPTRIRALGSAAEIADPAAMRRLLGWEQPPAATQPAVAVGDRVELTEEAWSRLPVGALVRLARQRYPDLSLARVTRQQPLGAVYLQETGERVDEGCARPWRHPEMISEARVIALGISEDPAEIAKVVARADRWCAPPPAPGRLLAWRHLPAGCLALDQDGDPVAHFEDGWVYAGTGSARWRKLGVARHPRSTAPYFGRDSICTVLAVDLPPHADLEQIRAIAAASPAATDALRDAIRAAEAAAAAAPAVAAASSALVLEAALARAEELIGAEGFATLREVAASPVDVARGVKVRSTTGSHDRAQVRVERGQAQLDAACTCNRCAEIAAVLPREAARRVDLPADPRERLAALVALVAESPSVALTLAPWALVQAALASTKATPETPKARPYGWLPRTGGRESGRLAAGLAVSRGAFDLRTLRLGDLELREVAPWIWRVEREAAGLALCKGSTTQALSGMDALARLAGRPSLAEEQEAEHAAVMSYEQAAAALGPAFASAPPEVLCRGSGERRVYYVDAGQAAIALPRGGFLRLRPRADAVVVVCLADWSRSPAQAGVARVEREAARHVRRNCDRATIVVALDRHQQPIAWVGPTDEPCRV